MVGKSGHTAFQSPVQAQHEQKYPVDHQYPSDGVMRIALCLCDLPPKDT